MIKKNREPMARNLAIVASLAILFCLSANPVMSQPAEMQGSTCPCLNASQFTYITNVTAGTPVSYNASSFSGNTASSAITRYMQQINLLPSYMKTSLLGNLTSVWVASYSAPSRQAYGTELLIAYQDAPILYDTIHSSLYQIPQSLGTTSANQTLSGLTYFYYNFSGILYKNNTILYGLEANTLIVLQLDLEGTPEPQKIVANAVYTGFISALPVSTPTVTGISTSSIPPGDLQSTGAIKTSTAFYLSPTLVLVIGAIILILLFGFWYNYNTGQKLRKLHETSPSFITYASRLFKEQGEKFVFSDSTKALEGFDKEIQKKSTDPNLHYRKGMLLSKMGRVDEAIMAFRDAIKLNPKESRYRLGMAAALRKVGRNAEADKEYDTAVKLNYDKQGDGQA